MDQKCQSFHIQKQILIRKNTCPITQVYSYDQNDKIGQGAYGSVYKATHKITKQVRAVKVINKVNIKYKERLLNEITIMEMLDHPHILRLFETFEDAEYLYMVLEICQGGDVFDKVLEKGNLPVEEAFKVYIQYMRAVNYYQGYNIIHRDLKPENFLFHQKNDTTTLSVIDFGIAKIGTGKLKTKSGTAYYVAPEVLEGCYDYRCDIWSAGVILYVIMCGYPPFYGENEKEILQEIKSGALQFEGDEWTAISKDIKEFIKQQICPAENRATIKDLLANPLLEQYYLKFRQADGNIISMANLTQFSKFPPVKRIGLFYLATQLDFTELRNHKVVFFQINTSQTGLITQLELSTFLKASKQDIKNLWSYVDCNNNGFMDYFEFIAVTLTPKEWQKHMQIMFDFLSQQEKCISQKSIKQICDANQRLDHKWDSILESKPQFQKEPAQPIQIKSVIDKDMDFNAFKTLMG